MKLLQKKISIEDLKEEILEEKKIGKKIVLCLGVFDLVHPGHIKHLQQAKEAGDILVVAVTANAYVNKGPDRPVFNQDLRMDSIAAIGCVDYVILNDNPDGIRMIEEVQPHYYVKGIEYKKHEDDITGKIKEEIEAIAKVGGEIIYTDDIVFSSSKLLNTYFSDQSEEMREYIAKFKQKYSYSSIAEHVENLQKLKVLVIGDAIIDQYTYVTPLGIAGKGTHLVARECYGEYFLGGSFAVANHIAAFTPHVTLLTAIGKLPEQVNLEKNLNSNIKKQLTHLADVKNLIKKRYIQRDGQFLTKLFETYSVDDNVLNKKESDHIIEFIKKNEKKIDLVVVADFGNGFINAEISDAISSMSSFLAINTQINSGNRGYHVVTKYKRADYISLNEPELRLTAHDLHSDLESIAKVVAKKMSCNTISVTRGVNGVAIYNELKELIKMPAFTQKVVDRIGAGDSYLALSSLSLSFNKDAELAGFLGSIAAAMDVQIVGNKNCIEKIPFLKYITTLIK